MSIIVRNVEGSSKKWPKPACKCSTWIEHWDNNSGYNRPLICPSCRKIQSRDNPLVGGHVQKVSKNKEGNYILSIDQTIYIVPICDKCNKVDKKVFSIDSNLLVTMAADTCNS